jgi:hypothetical protein
MTAGGAPAAQPWDLPVAGGPGRVC